MINQYKRLSIYKLLSPILFISIFIFNEYKLYVYISIAILMVLILMERCKNCQNPLLLFGYKVDAKKKHLICKKCGHHQDA